MIQSFLDAWSDPQMRHAMVVHFPVVLSVVTLPLAVLAALWLGKDRGRVFQWITLCAYLVLTVSLYVAGESGEDAEHAAGPMAEAGELELEEHEHHGHNLWQWPLVICVVAGLGFVRVKPVRIAAAWLVVGGGLLVAERVAHTADHGGRLVYVHGAVSGPGTGTASIDSSAPPPAADPRITFFREQVRPVFIEHCLRCHNPTRKRRAGELDQTTIAGILTGGLSGPAIVPGRPGQSLLIEAVRWDNEDLQMPMLEDKLPDQQIAALEKWIADGAVWEAFSYTPPAGKTN
jgi:mono/diheme cytochrome c family protein